MGSQKKVPLRKTWKWKVGGTVGTDCDSAATAAGAYEILNGEANMLVKRVQCTVVTATTGASGWTVGDTGDTDGYIATIHGQAAGTYPDGAEHSSFIGAYMFTSTAGATDAADVSRSRQERLVASATDINLTIAGTASAGEIIVNIDYEIAS